MDYSIISISGEVAAGKSSIVNQLSILLPDWEKLNTGQRFREFCASQGIPILYAGFISDDIHIAFDKNQVEVMKSGKKLIVDGRLAGWLSHELSYSFRVYCIAPFNVRVNRYMDRELVTYEQATSDVNYIDSEDLNKFRKLYNINDYRAHQFYNLMLDSSEKKPKELANIILDAAGLRATQ